MTLKEWATKLRDESRQSLHSMMLFKDQMPSEIYQEVRVNLHGLSLGAQVLILLEEKESR